MQAAVAESMIAQALDIGTRAVRLRAVKDDWPVMRKPTQGGSERFFIRDLLPVDVRQRLVEKEAVTRPPVPAVIHDTPVPKRSGKIGLAKYNLVHAFRLAKERAAWGEKGQAAEAFLLAYNSGLILPQVFNVVGEVQPKTMEALDKKLRENKDNYLCLCDGRGGWKKHGTTRYRGRDLSEQAKAVFLKCYLHGSQPTVQMAIRAASRVLEERDEPENVSESTWRRWLKDYEKFNAGVICLAREGMKAYQDKFGPYISRDPDLLDVGQCLVADGKTLNFFIEHPITGRPCRMTLLVFFDWKSRYPCGWHIMPTENKYGILSAFRNAVQTLGKYPQSVYLDNGRAFKSRLFTHIDPDFTDLSGLYARVGTAVFFAKPYNGRSKVVERFFKTIQDQLEWIMPSYCGDSIQSRPPWMNRNEKFQKAWHEARTQGWIPTIREAAVIIDMYFQWYAQQPQENLPAPPADMFLPHRGPGVDPVQLNHDFLWRIPVRPRKCRIRLWKIDYEADFLHNLSPDLEIYAAVNTADLRTVWCYTTDQTYLGEAYPIQACHPLAKLFGDAVALEQVVDANKRQARLARATKTQLTALGITKDAEDCLNVLPFVPKKADFLPVMETRPPEEAGPAPLPEKEVRRLEKLAARAKAEGEVPPEIKRPDFWPSELEHYDWCFKYVHRHGRRLSAEDQAFSDEFEARPEFENYRQRYEDLRLIF